MEMCEREREGGEIAWAPVECRTSSVFNKFEDESCESW